MRTTAALLVALALFAVEVAGAARPIDVSQDDAVAVRVPITVRAIVPSREIAVGEPFELSIVCEHGVDVEVRAATRVRDEVLDPAAGWHVFETRAVPDVPVGGGSAGGAGFADDERLVSTIVYRVAALSLAPFENEETGGLGWSPRRTLAGLGVEARVVGDDVPNGSEGTNADVEDAANDAAGTFVFVPVQEPEGGIAVLLRSPLVPGEDRPRPLPDPVRPEDSDGSLADWRRAAWIGGGGLAVFAVALLVAWRGSRVEPPAAAEPTRTARLEALRERIASGEQDLREAAFGLVGEVRASLAERGVPNDRAATDEQWRAGVDVAHLVRGEREDLDRFLARAEAVRFAPERPTRWAVEDLVRAALEIESYTVAGAGDARATEVRAGDAATVGDTSDAADASAPERGGDA